MRPDIAVDDPRWTKDLDVEALATQVLARAALEAATDVEWPAEVSLLFADDRRIADLKSAWLGKDEPTNVLSFPAADPGLGDTPFLGDIIVSYDTIAREARAEGKTLEAHLSHMILHGFLHLLGYDHIDDEEAQKMEALESRVLMALGIADPWGALVGHGDGV